MKEAKADGDVTTEEFTQVARDTGYAAAFETSSREGPDLSIERAFQHICQLMTPSRLQFAKILPEAPSAALENATNLASASQVSSASYQPESHIYR